MQSKPRMRGVRLASIAVVVALGIAVAACGGSETRTGSNDLPPLPEREQESGGHEVQTTGTTPEGDRDLLQAPGAAQEAVDDIVDELGPIRVSEINVYDSYVIFEGQHPTRRENFDRYIWRGGEIEPPEPVNVSGHSQEELEAELFGLDEVAWARVPELVQAALDQTMLEGGSVTLVGVGRSVFDDGAVLIRINVSGARRSGALEAAPDGTILEITTY